MSAISGATLIIFIVIATVVAAIEPASEGSLNIESLMESLNAARTRLENARSKLMEPLVMQPMDRAGDEQGPPKSFLQRRSRHGHKKPLVAVQLHLVEPGMAGDDADDNNGAVSLMERAHEDDKMNPAVMIDGIDKSERKQAAALEEATASRKKLTES
ncbi:hypothetical protein FOZ61_009056 [Perkinsus olseni]|uniref:Secreted protein n=1 Tax=Perkinsus olseni TaxID=32597 RepID=A0A7J6L1N6_PEROL|nr:hypothetical protein FOZ61_009056 [Perkinsus olseni]KAF4657345.1 hypothetical protein FOL46_007453 [Perkinsus olseni]